MCLHSTLELPEHRVISISRYCRLTSHASETDADNKHSEVHPHRKFGGNSQRKKEAARPTVKTLLPTSQQTNRLPFCVFGPQKKPRGDVGRSGIIGPRYT